MIKGESCGKVFKITKDSKFIKQSNDINSLLSKKVWTQIKRDEKAYSTYSLNPFAFYPKNIKNTVQALLMTKDYNQVANFQKKYDLAFVDVSLYDKEVQKGTIVQDIHNWQKQEMNRMKNRHLASTQLQGSYHIKNTFEMWYRLHSRQKFDHIQKRMLGK